MRCNLQNLMAFSAAIRSGSYRNEAAHWAVKLGRFGLVARGLVYLMVGFLAVRAAIGIGGKFTDKQGAVNEIELLPFGNVIMWAVALGLFAYIAWRFTHAVLDLDHKGSDLKGLAKRSGGIFSGLAYSGVATAALAAAAHRPSLRLGKGGGGDAAAQDWTAWLMSQPFGRALALAAGATIAAIAIFQLYQAVTCKFAKHIRGGGLTASQETWSRRIGRVGYAARGIAFGVIAWFIVDAAVEKDAERAGGLASAFRTLADQPYGQWLVGAVGAGFGLFGIYSMIEARYRRIG